MKRKGILLLLDFSNLFYRGLHVHPNLSYQGQPTGGLYGFIIQLAKLVNEFKPDLERVVLCGDCPPYLRKEEYPGYKERRGKQDKEQWKITQHNLKLCWEFLEILGQPLQKTDGLEADDLIAIYSERFERGYKKIIAVSSDTDLYQLLDQQNLFLYLGTADKRRMVGRKEFHKLYPFRKASTWTKVVAYTGGHNDLPGIYGVGEKTAIKLLTSSDQKWIEKRRDYKRKHGKQIRLTERLATLPYPKINAEDVSIVSNDKYHHGDMMRFLNSVGIDFTIPMEDAFDYLALKG